MIKPALDFINQKLQSANFTKLLIVIVAVALLAGVGTGFAMSKGEGQNAGSPPESDNKIVAKSAQQDRRTFRDFAEGTVAKKPDPTGAGDYSEGTHLLVREGSVPVALTSSVVDMSEYEGKKVKVYGETQKAIKEGWLMDVGRVEVQ